MGCFRNILDIIGFLFMLAAFIFGLFSLFRAFRIGLIRTVLSSLI